jgi:hypothetical protein
MNGQKNQKKCKPLGYQQEIFQMHLQFTRTFTKGIYNLQEHLQKTFTKIKCIVKLECKSECQNWVQEKNNRTTKKWKKKKKVETK